MVCEENICTGCMACYSACNGGAINIKTDSKGFYVPQIDMDICIDCGVCREACPLLNKQCISDFQKQILACWSTDGELRQKSTSGGVFTGIAQYVISKNGTVFGARFDDEFKVIHAEANSLEELKHFRGSKYVQSYIGDIYKIVKERLKYEQLVLFTGTPCQNAGLKQYLGNKYENLITVDFVCHGVPSPLVFKDYIGYIRKTINNDISNIQFRYKKPSWTVFSMKIDFLTHQSYIADAFTDPYLIGFLNDYFSRECCHNCKFTNLNRPSDITIADFWGYISDDKKFRNDEKGISLVVINSPNGSHIFNEIKGSYIVVPKTIEEAMVGNKCLSNPYAKNSLSDDFWSDYLINRDFEFARRKYFYKRKPSLKNKVSRFINDHSYLMSKRMRIKYEKVKSKLK
ncbi:MAG: Coenzyme F420 hydrogenase/dehydrogenase, beta subunit C-terminal domain [Bacillota bacterium]